MVALLTIYQANISNQSFPYLFTFTNYLASEAFLRHYMQLPPRLFAKFNIEKQYFSRRVNKICNGTSARIRRDGGFSGR